MIDARSCKMLELIKFKDKMKNNGVKKGKFEYEMDKIFKNLLLALSFVLYSLRQKTNKYFKQKTC